MNFSFGQLTTSVCVQPQYCLGCNIIYHHFYVENEYSMVLEWDFCRQMPLISLLLPLYVICNGVRYKMMRRSIKTHQTCIKVDWIKLQNLQEFTLLLWSKHCKILEGLLRQGRLKTQRHVELSWSNWGMNIHDKGPY